MARMNPIPRRPDADGLPYSCGPSAVTATAAYVHRAVESVSLGSTHRDQAGGRHQEDVLGKALQPDVLDDAVRTAEARSPDHLCRLATTGAAHDVH